MEHEAGTQRHSDAPRATRGGARRWLALLAVALLLGGFSQLIWLWHTWPVRQLLEARAVPVEPA